MNTFQLFITSTVGFEKELFQELQSHSFVQSIQMGKGGVYCSVESFDHIIWLNYALHTANRVLIELCSVPAPTQKGIYQALYAIEWKRFFPRDETFMIEVPFSAHPDFQNTLFAAQFMKDPLCDRLRKETGKRPFIDTKEPDIRFQALLTEDEFRFYFDSSNIPLFKRGYRGETMTHVAPLKETLAAALLLRAGFKPGVDLLVDPCAGSGTFVIEAELMARKIAPGLLRKKFGFQRHPLYDSDDEMRIKRELQKRADDVPVDSISKSIAIEKESSSYRLLLQCLIKAGLMGSVHTIQSDFQRLSIELIKKVNGKSPTFIVTNPPYGVRMKASFNQLDQLYHDLGSFMKQVIEQEAIGAILIPEDGNFIGSVGLRSQKRVPVLQGGIPCSLVVYDLFPRSFKNDDVK